MSDGEIIRSAPYQDLLTYCQEFQNLVNAHKDTIGVSDLNKVDPRIAKEISIKDTSDVQGSRYIESAKPSPADQLIETEEREMGDTGLKPYILYLCQNKGFLYSSLCVMCHIVFISGQISQNSWMAANVQNSDVSTLKLISVYIAIGVGTMFFLLFRSLSVVLGMQTSRSFFSQLLTSLFRAPMSFFDSTPLGRVLSRQSVAGSTRSYLFSLRNTAADAMADESNALEKRKDCKLHFCAKRKCDIVGLGWIDCYCCEIFPPSTPCFNNMDGCLAKCPSCSSTVHG
ncbi:hypothetical protein EJB05_46089, partial [Eragrostis curvula]